MPVQATPPAAPPTPPAKPKTKADEFIANAMKYLGTPYLWGGGHSGDQHGGGRVDCSGLVNQAGFMSGLGTKFNGVASSQQAQSQHISKADLKPGDLCFCGNPAHHVGIYIGNGKVLQAPHTGANVDICSVDAFDNFGRIFDQAGAPVDTNNLPASAMSSGGGSSGGGGSSSGGGGSSSGGGDTSSVGSGGSPAGGQASQLSLPSAPASAGRSARSPSGAGGVGASAAPAAAAMITDPFADFSPDLRASLDGLGDPPDPVKLADLAKKYGMDINRLKAYKKRGKLPTDMVEGAHGGQCGAWMMAERRKMGLPSWDFAAAKDLMWNYPKDKVELVKTPQVGDAFVMTGGQYGHTGFVKAVNTDGTVTVEDSNWGFNEIEHTHKIAMSSIAAYLHDK